MKIQITKKYFVLPVNDNAVLKKVLLFDEKTLIYDFDCRIDFTAPDYYTYVNVERFKSRTFTLVIDPEYPFVPEQTDVLPPVRYDEPFRPYFHFAAHHGWLNDPNGAFYYNGQYHIFFQYNEAFSDWGNMSWGHAISRDLIHWTQLDTVLFPDELGTVFSGSAWVDYRNDSHLKETDHPPILLYYTSAGGCSRLSQQSEYVQCLAYSVDGGNTFRKYQANPIISHIINENRDPRVNYSPELGKYIMMLYLEEQSFLMLTSDNLLDWTQSQIIDCLPDSECPDIYPLTVEESGERKWIISGLSHQYVVGEFLNGQFVPSQPARKLHYGYQRRASQTFTNAPNNRTVCASWDPIGGPAGTSFRCQLGTPMQLSLRHDGNGYSLCTAPADELRLLHGQSHSIKNIRLTPDCSYRHELKHCAFNIAITLHPSPKPIVISFFGTQMIADFSCGKLYFKQSVMPFASDKELSLRILCDRCTVEVYLNDGSVYACNEHHCNYSNHTFALNSCEPVEIPLLEIIELGNIWATV